MKKSRKHEKMINLTFFEKDFYKKADKLNLSEKEKMFFIKEMCCLTPAERNCLIEKITHFFI